MFIIPASWSCYENQEGNICLAPGSKSRQEEDFFLVNVLQCMSQCLLTTQRVYFSLLFHAAMG